MQARRFLPFLICFLASGTGSAALLTLDLNSQSAASMVAGLLGPGITASNIVYTGDNSAAGTFGGGAGIIGFSVGMLLSSGDIRNIRGPNDNNGVSAVNTSPGDADLELLIGAPTFDAAVLEFDFVPSSGTLHFSYVFASDEYPEYVGQFNDGFALFVNGVNVALLPATAVPVTINNVNTFSNPSYYVNNALPGATLDTQMDGLTVVFGVTVTVAAGLSNHMKIVVADANDRAFDSVVLLKASSFTAPSPTPSRTASPTRSPTLTPSPTGTVSETPTATLSVTATLSRSPTMTPSLSATPTATFSPTFSASPTRSGTASATPSATPSPSATLSPSFSVSPTFSASPSVTPTFTQTPLPLILHLLPPSPNPAGGDLAWLPWYISVDSYVGIEVFTVSGERVRSLEVRHYRTGYSEREWDLKNESGLRVASGTFIYRVTARSERQETEQAYSKCAVLR